MKEQFFVTRVLIDNELNNGFHTFVVINPEGHSQPPTFDTYKDAQEFVQHHGIKYKYYQIQKFLMPC